MIDGLWAVVRRPGRSGWRVGLDRWSMDARLRALSCRECFRGIEVPEREGGRTRALAAYGLEPFLRLGDGRPVAGRNPPQHLVGLGQLVKPCPAPPQVVHMQRAVREVPQRVA